MANLVPIQAAAIGGTLVGVLVKQIARIKAASRLTGNRAKTIEEGRILPNIFATPPNIYFIAAAPVSARLQEQYRYESEITKHAVESGVIYSDHIILHPIRVDIEAEMSNCMYGVCNAKNSLECFEALRNDRTSVELILTHKTLPDMFLAEFTALNEPPAWGKLHFRASFQQINSVTLQIGKASKSLLSLSPAAKTSTPDVSMSAAPPKKAGRQKPQTKKHSDADYWYGMD